MRIQGDGGNSCERVQLTRVDAEKGTRITGSQRDPWMEKMIRSLPIGTPAVTVRTTRKPETNSGGDPV